MRPNPNINKLMSIMCWLGTAIVAVLEFYMLRMASKFPEIESFARNTRIAGVLLLAWLAVAVWFTVQTEKDKKK